MKAALDKKNCDLLLCLLNRLDYLRERQLSLESDLVASNQVLLK